MKKKKMMMVLMGMMVVACSTNKQQERQQETAACTAIDSTDVVEQQTAPEEHITFFGIPIDGDSATMADRIFAQFPKVEQPKKWIGGRERSLSGYIQINHLTYGVELTGPAQRIQGIEIHTAPIDIAFEQADLRRGRRLYDSLLVEWGQPIYRLGGRKGRFAPRMADWHLPLGWCRWTGEACCATEKETVAWEDRTNALLNALGAEKMAEVRTDSCELGTCYRSGEKMALLWENGVWPLERKDELLIVPNYKGQKTLEARFGRGSFYQARVKNSEYPKLVFPMDENLVYDSVRGEVWPQTADSSTVVVQSWVLPEGGGYLYYVFHQIEYTDSSPTWTILIWSPTTLRRKFIHRRYTLDHFWPHDFRYVLS